MPYTPANAANLKMRWPEFANVDDGRVNFWLDDAALRTVKADDWSDPDGALAQMLVAAHNLAMEGGGGSEGGGVPAGVAQMRSGALSLSFDSAYVANQASGGWAATKYGAQFLDLLRSYRGGVRVTSAPVGGAWDCQDVHGRSLSGLHPSW